MAGGEGRVARQAIRVQLPFIECAVRQSDQMERLKQFTCRVDRVLG
jgi:hypothetical protein